MTAERSAKKPPLRALVVIGLLGIFAFALVLGFVIQSTSAPAAAPISAASYAEEVAAALKDADAARGAVLSEAQNCAACHVLGDGTVGPLFDGIAARAAQQRPPLSAEQYLYEAITAPGVYVLEPYANTMPSNYGELLSVQEIGHIIAYLLTFGESAALE